MGKAPDGVRKRVLKPAEERRADLLDAALEVFAERGVADATVNDITSRAQVAKGTFYLYFSAKEQVVAALWERYVTGYMDLAQAVLTDRDESDALTDQAGTGVLTELLERLIDHAVENAELHRIVYGSADAKALALCAETNQRVIDLLAEAIERGMNAGTLRPGHPQVFARILYHGAHATLHDASSESGPSYTRADVKTTVQTIVQRTLAPA
ncbi:TetR/AcrR family transcriptional regulator [Actinomadura rupiterrae]|uniref:TetR/AcrR family transcriptional regulator n=1 Tax=Actinomadura rupiterrae TaxID=559627 RepID=UPI0020A5EA9B|nr:TetR/AcrR family transcriptional regulator [Actinomadura rupiterrae]MCP2340684.1 AcrR family transcriptional regulator [Actinomadura rupiterrae]